MKKLIILCFLLLSVFTEAQYKNETNSSDSKNIIFSTQQSDYSAEVLSDSEKLITKKNIDLYLKLSSDFIIDSAYVNLSLQSNNGNVRKEIILRKYSSDSYKTSVKFPETGLYKFTFYFTLKDSSGNQNGVSFSFNEDVLKKEKVNRHKSEFMGMSTTIMIIMGAAILIMMGIIMATGGGH